MGTIITQKQRLNLYMAMEYYDDAPAECWQDTEIRAIVYSGGWGRCFDHPDGGLMGKKFNGYEFKYHGLPVGIMMDYLY